MGMILYVWYYGNPFKGPDTNTAMMNGARFISLDGDVKVVRASTRQTISARSDTQLLPGDIVQTQMDGRARIMLVDGSTLVIRPNSVITVRDNSSLEDGQKTKVRVAIDRGQINVRTEKQNKDSSNIVETKQTQNRLSPQTGASFGVREDKTEDIRVDAGTIETTTKSGEKTVVREGEFMEVNQTGNISKREKLLNTPSPLFPQDLSRIPVTPKGAANITIKWQRPGGQPTHYRVEVATSPFFVSAGNVFERDQLEATELILSGLKPGVYFWRVRAASASGQVSEWSDPQKFSVIEKTEGGKVVASNFSIEYIAGSLYLVHGKSQPGNIVRVGSRSNIVDKDGTFKIQINIPESTREVTLEAEDPQGNTSQYKIPIQNSSLQRNSE
jgi:hypothetical protein